MRHSISLATLAALAVSAQGQLVLPWSGIDPSATLSSFQITKSGASGRANTLYITNASNTSDVLLVNTIGLGRAAYFTINNASNTQIALRADSNGSGTAIFGFMSGLGRAGYFRITNAENSSPALYAQTNGTGVALKVQAGAGGAAEFSGEVMVTGSGTTGTLGGAIHGVYGGTNKTTGAGVYGYGQRGVYGLSESTTGTGLYGMAMAGSGVNLGVYGQSNSPQGYGVSGFASATTGNGIGVSGHSNGTSGRGVYGLASTTTGPGFGVYGQSNSTTGLGVFGFASALTGEAYGVYGQSASSSGQGVVGEAVASAGVTYGVYGFSNSTAGFGGYFKGKGADALFVQNIGSGRGAHIVAESDTAVWGITNTGPAGVDGRSASPTGFGVYAQASSPTGANSGVYGRSESVDGTGVFGETFASTGFTFGVKGISASTSGRGVMGVTTAGTGNTYGVVGISYSPWPGAFAVFANGVLGASGTKPFRIDHPFNPANEYLLHYSSEGPIPMNIYTGTVTTDGNGVAWVQLPDYFGEINKDFQYQLTVVDDTDTDSFVIAKVAKTIHDNKFKIRTSEPRAKVCWEVKGTRNDLWMRRYGAPVEMKKEGLEKGTYQHPELYGKPKEMGLHYQPTGK